LESNLSKAGVDPDTNSKVMELREQYNTAGSPEALTNEVFSHLTNFFRRYYHQGDFISQRRYKKDVYAIPYEGEEVKLHWANHDQYYIKTSEYFKNYSFKIDGGKTVTFALRDASTEQNNNKAQSNKERRFKLAEENFLTTEGDELKIWFTYEPTDKKAKQDDLLADAFKQVQDGIPNAFKAGALKATPTEKNKGRTLLEKQLKSYAARNTFDYFIHKDLGGFLQRELDFYIKNEILQIDDIDLNNTQSFERQLRIIKALKGVAQHIIAMLSQLENFQKKLWLKKKFVVQSDWCITLDRIPEEFYADIAANDAQREEWISLFAIDEIKADLTNPGYSKKLTVDFLKANHFLLVDTQFFTTEWKYKLLAQLDQLDQQTDGLLINSENFQALNAIRTRYLEQIDCVYIDPPYNANSSEIVYKNTYKHSSWLSLMENRIGLSKSVLSNDFVYVTAIDEVEQEVLGQLFSRMFPDDEKNCITVIHNATGQQGNNFSFTHEFAYFIHPTGGQRIGLENREDNPDVRPLRNVSKGSHLRSDAANCFYPIKIKGGKIVGFGDVSPDAFHPKGINVSVGNGVIEVYPIDPQGVERKWVFARNSVEKIFAELNPVYDKKKSEWDIIRTKTRFNFKTVWGGAKYSANSYGSRVLNEILPSSIFTFPKSINTVRDAVDAALNNRETGTVLDYFAGSGTTGHAVINLNREDRGQRKYILVEMGEYFNTVTKPRVQRVAYSPDWKGGKPVSRNGSSHCFKYQRLESYEDTLNNLELQRSSQQESLLTNDGFSDEYMLNYMLDVESRQSLLSTEMFKQPFGYKIKVTENNELREQEVDMVETFNYLIGLVVESMQLIRGTVVVQGHNLQGEKILVIWRDVAQMDNAALNDFFKKLAINTKDTEFRRIYVNGDNNLENLRTDDEQWKVVLIEEEFHKRMFDTKDV